MHGLTADVQDRCDLLPRPALLPGVVDLQRLKLLDQSAQGGNGFQSNLRIPAGGCLRSLNLWGDLAIGRLRSNHIVNLD